MGDGEETVQGPKLMLPQTTGQYAQMVQVELSSKNDNY